MLWAWNRCCCSSGRHHKRREKIFNSFREPRDIEWILAEILLLTSFLPSLAALRWHRLLVLLSPAIIACIMQTHTLPSKWFKKVKFMNCAHFLCCATNIPPTQPETETETAAERREGNIEQNRTRRSRHEKFNNSQIQPPLNDLKQWKNAFGFVRVCVCVRAFGRSCMAWAPWKYVREIFY